MSDTDLKFAILAAYKRLLRPLVRILIRNGVSFGEFTEVAKHVYVEIAAEDFRLEDKPMTQGRIAILTGLTRKEVNRLIVQRGAQRGETASNLNRVTRLLSGWHTDSHFTGPYGLPLDVPFDSADDDRSFVELVRRYSGDMTPRAMLDELLRINVVRQIDNDRIRVVTRTYLPSIDAPESIDLLGSAVRDVVETMDFNRTESDPEKRLFERTVTADDGVRLKDLPRMRAYVRERAQFLLEEIDDWLSKLEPIDTSSSEPVLQTRVSIFHYVGKEND